MKTTRKSIAVWFTISAVVSCITCATGCGGGRVTFAENPVRPPNVKNLSVAPTKLARFLGGQVTVSAQVKGASKVDSVTARIVRQQDGQALPDAPLQRLVGTNTYQATVAAPANTRSDGQSETYAVTIVAVSGGVMEQKSAGTFEVPAPPAAPGLPSVP